MLNSLTRVCCAAAVAGILTGGALGQIRPSIGSPPSVAGPIDQGIEDPGPSLDASEAFSGSLVAFRVHGSYSHFTVTVAGPGDFQARAYDQYRAPTVRLDDFGALQDGLYRYEITAASFEYGQRSQFDNGRDTTATPRIGVSRSGIFRVDNGMIAPLSAMAEAE